MPVNHSFDATADRPAPIEIVGPSIEHVAIVGTGVVKPCGVIHTNSAAGRIKQPAIECDTDTSPQCRVEIAVGFTKGIRRSNFTAVAVQIHVANVELGSGHQPVPLKIVTELPSTVEPRFAVAPFFIREIPIIEIGCLAMTELPARVETNIESGPIAKRWSRSWCNNFTSFPTVHLRSGKRCC